MLKIPNAPDCAFCFWVGIPFATQVHILKLCAHCSTIDSIAVFRDRADQKWVDPEEGHYFRAVAAVLALTVTVTLDCNSWVATYIINCFQWMSLDEE